ncbi:MAG: cytochrome C oxidase subunit IV family protein [Flavobacteriales bacterium]
MGAHTEGSTKKIWIVFFILLVVTAVEVGLGIYNSENPGVINWTFLKWTFIVLTLFKAYYIVAEFMHLGHERKSLNWSLALPIVILVPYLLFILLNEASYIYELMHA